MRISRLARLARHPLTAALLLAAALQWLLAAGSPIIAKDGITFIRMAMRLGSDFREACRLEDQHPGYPCLLLASRWLTRFGPSLDELTAWTVAGRLASAACGLAAIVLVWLYARRLYDRRIAGLAALLAAVWPLLRHSAGDVLSDTPHLALYLASVWLSCEALVRRRAAWFAAAGAASGLAFWLRPEGLLVALCAMAVIAVVEGRRSFRSALAGITALGTAACLVVVPYPLLAGKLTSKLDDKLKHFKQASARAPLGRPATRAPASCDQSETTHSPASSPAPPIPLPAWASHLPQSGLVCEPVPGGTLPDEHARPRSTWGVWLYAVLQLGRELAQGFYYLLLIPLAVGRFAPGRLRWQRAPAVMMSTVWYAHAGILLALYFVAGYIGHRHVLPLVVLLLPTTAAGLVWIAERLPVVRRAGSPAARLAHRWVGRRAPASFALATLMTITMAALAVKSIRPPNKCFTPVVSAARWVREHAQRGDSVLATSGYVPFYANLKGVVLGSQAPDLATGLTVAPDSRPWTFLVLEIDQRRLDQERLDLLNAAYERVVDLPAHPRKVWLRVLVYRLKPEVSSRVSFAMSGTRE